jgi:hypothetical protein
MLMRWRAKLSRAVLGLVAVTAPLMALFALVMWPRSNRNMDWLHHYRCRANADGSVDIRGAEVMTGLGCVGISFTHQHLPAEFLREIGREPATFNSAWFLHETSGLPWDELRFWSAGDNLPEWAWRDFAFYLTNPGPPQHYTGGFAFIVPLWLVAALCGLVAAVAWRRVYLAVRARRRRRMGLCAQCGYDIRANSGACPECGTPVPSPRLSSP